jgi:hypothetical protein
MSANVTKEGVEVQRGQLWRDLDKRMGNRVCRVGKVVDGKAEMFRMVRGQAGGRTWVSVRRMHKASTGWELVQDVDRAAIQQPADQGAKECAERGGDAN